MGLKEASRNIVFDGVEGSVLSHCKRLGIHTQALTQYCLRNGKTRVQGLEDYKAGRVVRHYWETESMNKHKAVRHEYRGMKFDSGRELKRWKELEILEAAGKIKFLHRQSAVCAGQVGCPEPSPQACAALCGGLCVLLQRARAADC